MLDEWKPPEIFTALNSNSRKLHLSFFPKQCFEYPIFSKVQVIGGSFQQKFRELENIGSDSSKKRRILPFNFQMFFRPIAKKNVFHPQKSLRDSG